MTLTGITARSITVSYVHPIFGTEITTIPAGTTVQVREHPRRADRARIIWGAVFTQTVSWDSIRCA